VRRRSPPGRAWSMHAARGRQLRLDSPGLPRGPSPRRARRVHRRRVRAGSGVQDLVVSGRPRIGRVRRLQARSRRTLRMDPARLPGACAAEWAAPSGCASAAGHSAVSVSAAAAAFSAVSVAHAELRQAPAGRRDQDLADRRRLRAGWRSGAGAAPQDPTARRRHLPLLGAGRLLPRAHHAVPRQMMAGATATATIARTAPPARRGAARSRTAC